MIYKKPTVSIDKFFVVLSHILSKTNRIILVGDTNINIQMHSAQTAAYYSFIESLGYRLLNNQNKKFATRINKHINARHTKSSTIDHVICNCFGFKYTLFINDSHLSDHQEILLSFRDATNKLVKFCQTKSSFVCKNLQFENFRRMLSRELSRYTPANISYLLRLIDNVKTRCTRTRIIFKKK